MNSLTNSRFRPLLAATLDEPHQLIWPKLVSPKLDGIRCLIYEGQAVSRNLKPIRNQFIQETLRGLPDGLDGELIVGKPNEGNVLNRTTSGVMSATGTPDFKYHVFDNFNYTGGFHARYLKLEEALKNPHEHIVLVPHLYAFSEAEFLDYEGMFLRDGFEGIMARSTTGKYKMGRATHQEQILHKFKRFSDSEIFITNILEGVTNENENTRDALGESVRSSHKSGLVPNGRVGTIVGNDTKTNQAIEISPGRMNHDMRRFYWENPSKIVGRIATYRYFGYGQLHAPRFPTFQAFREEGV